ncbi:hypothetical protein DU505_19325 [Billgrantia montanilacus]|uniref:Uncharacterized protein n=1 Tax=Billgrantia montanilacus TaxID=2282305 RepID=A0A368TR60_9GAMM|nr:hypothetical protein DU505_19325 [Halomonas montanilacus]
MNQNLSGMHGQHDYYYVKRGNCKANASIKQPWLTWGWRSLKVTKDVRRPAGSSSASFLSIDRGKDGSWKISTEGLKKRAVHYA